MWPNVSTNWQASAKIASQATPPPFDLNHLMGRGPGTRREHIIPVRLVKRVDSALPLCRHSRRLHTRRLRLYSPIVYISPEHRNSSYVPGQHLRYRTPRHRVAHMIGRLPIAVLAVAGGIAVASLVPEIPRAVRDGFGLAVGAGRMRADEPSGTSEQRGSKDDSRTEGGD